MIAKNSTLREYEPQIEELLNFSLNILKTYNSYQMKDITYAEFIEQILSKDKSVAASNRLSSLAIEIKENVFASMDAYKKNKIKYLEKLTANDQYFFILFKSISILEK